MNIAQQSHQVALHYRHYRRQTRQHRDLDIHKEQTEWSWQYPEMMLMRMIQGMIYNESIPCLPLCCGHCYMTQSNSYCIAQRRQLTLWPGLSLVSLNFGGKFRKFGTRGHSRGRPVQQCSSAVWPSHAWTKPLVLTYIHNNSYLRSFCGTINTFGSLPNWQAQVQFLSPRYSPVQSKSKKFKSRVGIGLGLSL